MIFTMLGDSLHAGPVKVTDQISNSIGATEGTAISRWAANDIYDKFENRVYTESIQTLYESTAVQWRWRHLTDNYIELRGKTFVFTASHYVTLGGLNGYSVYVIFPFQFTISNFHVFTTWKVDGGFAATSTCLITTTNSRYTGMTTYCLSNCSGSQTACYAFMHIYATIPSS